MSLNLVLLSLSASAWVRIWYRGVLGAGGKLRCKEGEWEGLHAAAAADEGDFVKLVGW